MTWHPAPCGVHEYRRRVRICRVCEAANTETADLLANVKSRPSKWHDSVAERTQSYATSKRAARQRRYEERRKQRAREEAAR